MNRFGFFSAIPALIGFWLIVGLLFLLAGCQRTLAPTDELMISNSVDLVSVLAKLPPGSPDIRYNTDPNWPIAAEANCADWSITFNYRVAATRPMFVIEKVVPHEIAHLVSCYYRGSTDARTGDSHDEYWRQWVIRLGGDPNYI